MVVYLKRNIRSLLSFFKKKAGPRDQDEQKRLTVHYTTSQHYQENVFIEGSRPQYLEDLHTEALEGLKNLQQEEKNGVDVQDDLSLASTATLQTEEEASSPKEREGSLGSGSTAGQPGPTATSAVSTRPVLTRQGSTFKPLNPVKRLDKNRKRTRRTTIMGIPQQVQRELALHRGSMYQQGASSQLHGNGHAIDGAVVIPTIDGDTSVASPEGARVHLQDLEASREEQLLQHHLHAVYKDDQAFGNHHLGTRLSPTSSRRPKSLAVPGMTTPSSSTAFHFLQEPLGPVMSISPQATYLSKIIPNAILPASVDVIQIDRSNSRTRGNSINQGGNGRTVSRTSLGSGESSASPASSRRSGGDGSHADSFHNNPTATHPAASNSNRSQSQSSETIISNSSTFSSKEGSRRGMPQTLNHVRQGEQPKRTAGDQDLVSLNSSASWVSGTSSISGGPGTGQGSESGISGAVTAGESTRPFSRSLSILKTKLPPAPPQRTNSLHHDKVKKIGPRELVDVKDLSDSVLREEEITEVNSPARDENVAASMNSTFKCPVQVSDSPESRSLEDSRSLASPGPLSPLQSCPRAGGAPGPQAVFSNSSPQKVLSEAGKFERTMSPSSGYSSQSGTPTLSPKGISTTSPSPGKPKNKPVKPERSGSRASSVASASSSLTSLSSSTSEPVNHETQANIPGPPQQGSPPPVAVTTNKKTVMVNEAPSPVTVVTGELLNIPPPPKVKAPSPPPPETWAHNRRTFELLCGPCPNVNRLAQLNKQQQFQESNTKATTQTEVNNESQGSAKKQPVVEKVALSLPETQTISQGKVKPWLGTVPGCVSQEVESVECTKQRSLLESEKDKASVGVQRQEDSRNPIKASESQKSLAVAKTDSPAVVKKSIPVSLRTEPVCQQQKCFDDITTIVTNHVQSPTGNESVSVPKVDVDIVDKSKEVKVIPENVEENPTNSQLTIQTLSVDPPKVIKISPPPSPPPAHHPPPPPSKQTPPPSVSSPPSKERESVGEEEVVPIVETCWPPPPPPLDLVFDGSDEMDFPPPPPPMTESSSDVVESGTTMMGVQDDSMVAPAKAEVTVNGECTGESSITVQTGLEQSRPEIAGHSKIDSIISDAHQLRTLPEITPIEYSIPTSETAAGAAQEQIIIQEDTSLSMETLHLKNVTPPPPMQAPSPPLTTSVKESSGSVPLAPPPSVPLPPPLPFKDQPPSQPPATAPCPPPINGLSPSPPQAENQSAAGVAFRRQPSLVSRETRSKELSSRHKSAPIPKEDANIPLVTPSLLQMVRLRSVNVGEEQTKPQLEHNSSNGSALDQGPTSNSGPQGTPQKPIRKSLSLKSPPPSLRTPSVILNAPSMRLQEAIRMKTAAMSSRDGLPTRLNMRSSTSTTNCSTGEPGVQSLRSPEGGDLQKSPASTASFIFSRSTKKVVIETPPSSSTEAQESLKQSLAAELMQVSEQVSKFTVVVSNGVDEKSNLLRKPGKVPPPVAKKPVSCTANPTEMPARAEGDGKVTAGAEANRSTGTKQPAGQQVSPNEQREGNAETSDVVVTF